MKIHCRENHDWKSKHGIKWIKQSMQTMFANIYCKYMNILKCINCRYFAIIEPEELSSVNWLDELVNVTILEADDNIIGVSFALRIGLGSHDQ